mmetsp:Transcript_22904/g.35850  ORF Transcript_22904/g.35850 Transcript_22904/m.35850 type:complete len:86 (-) Transcript_22904:462-719(-)
MRTYCGRHKIQYHSVVQSIEFEFSRRILLDSPVTLTLNIDTVFRQQLFHRTHLLSFAQLSSNTAAPSYGLVVLLHLLIPEAATTG